MNREFMKIPVKNGKADYPNNCSKEAEETYNLVPSVKSLKDCFEFAHRMASKKMHKPESFLKGDKRGPKKIMLDALEGKLGEGAFYNFCVMNEDINIKINKPNLTRESRGFWEDKDFTIEDTNNNISIKTTKWNHKLLLLKKNDYDEKGRYKFTYEKGERKEADEPTFHHYIILCRIGGYPSSFNELKNMFTDKFTMDKPKTTKFKNQEEIENVRSEQLKIEVTGYITNDDFVNIIDNNHWLPKDVYLNTKTKLQVNNYSVCASDLRTEWAKIK